MTTLITAAKETRDAMAQWFLCLALDQVGITAVAISIMLCFWTEIHFTLTVPLITMHPGLKQKHMAIELSLTSPQDCGTVFQMIYDTS